MNENKKKKGFLGTVERVGNALPHPAIIFLLLCVIIAVVSHICAKLGVSVTYTGLDRSTNEIKETNSFVEEKRKRPDTELLNTYQTLISLGLTPEKIKESDLEAYECAKRNGFA